eukprot:RCo035806
MAPVVPASVVVDLAFVATVCWGEWRTAACAVALSLGVSLLSSNSAVEGTNTLLLWALAICAGEGLSLSSSSMAAVAAASVAVYAVTSVSSAAGLAVGALWAALAYQETGLSGLSPALVSVVAVFVRHRFRAYIASHFSGSEVMIVVAMLSVLGCPSRGTGIFRRLEQILILSTASYCVMAVCAVHALTGLSPLGRTLLLHGILACLGVGVVLPLLNAAVSPVDSSAVRYLLRVGFVNHPGFLLAPYWLGLLLCSVPAVPLLSRS